MTDREAFDTLKDLLEGWQAVPVKLLSRADRRQEAALRHALHCIAQWTGSGDPADAIPSEEVPTRKSSKKEATK